MFSKSETQDQAFDFLVVGGGTAGNTIAGRLAENPDVSIGVIEAGAGNPQDIAAITTPAKAFELRGSKHDWAFKATMVDRPDYTRIEKPDTRGKVLGGSSSLNYYTWLRGSVGTYDEWEEFGGPMWNWRECEEYFDKPCTYHDDRHSISPAIAKKLNRNGPLHVAVSDFVPELEPFREALTQAWTSKGEIVRDNIYEGKQEGLVKNLNSIYKGVRSTSASFLEGKSNITIIADTEATKIVIEDGVATGVEVVDFNSEKKTLKAKKEVILSAGVFQTPHLLMLSGIGPKKHLEEYDIPCLVDSSHVGQHLLDHPILAHVMQLPKGFGLDQHIRHDTLAKKAAIAAYEKDQTGPLHSGLLELVAFPRIDKQLEKFPEYRKAKEANGGLDPFGPDGQPHFEIDFVPMFADAFQWHIPPPADTEHDYLTVIVDLLRPVSTPGYVKLQSKDPRVQPEINENFCESDLDVLVLREGVRFIDDIILNGDGMKDVVGPDYPWPMPRESDKAMDQMILERLQTGFHPCGTTRLGKTIDQGVVDPYLKVHGVRGLRVVDAGVMPVIPDCRIQNGVYMIAEKGADMVKTAYPEWYKVEWTAKVGGSTAAGAGA